VLNDRDRVPRPVRPTDFLVVATGFLHNLTQVFEVLADELHELSVYHANQKTKTFKAWEDMANDLESLEEGTDG